MVKAISTDAARPRLPASRFLADTLSASVCLAATFLNFLNYNQYPAARLETALCLSILLLIAGLFGFVSARLRERERTLFAALFLAVVVQMSVGGGALLIAAVATVAILLRNRTIPFAGVTFFIVLVFQSAQALLPTAVTASPAARAERKSLPVLVHILLDGAIGIEGMPGDIPEARSAAAWGRDWLIENGFIVYGRVYSEHRNTVNSVPHIFGLGSEAHAERERFRYNLLSNRYFALLDERGYTITVYQNSAAKYCDDPHVDACWTAHGYRELARSQLPANQKTILLIRAFASLSSVIEFVAQVYDLVLAMAPRIASALTPLHWQDSRVPTPLGAMQALEELYYRVANAGPGEAHFAHVLLPHGPYTFDANCAMKPQHEWQGRQSAFRPRRVIYRAYVGQWRCAIRRIGELVDALRAARPDMDFVLLVHGDHGARVTPVDLAAANMDAFSPQDFRDTYSTLAAVRMPNVAPGYYRQVVPVRRFFEALVAADFKALPALVDEGPPMIFLEHPGSLAEGRRVAVPDLFKDD